MTKRGSLGISEEERERNEPAALLTEPLSQPGGDDSGS